MTQLNSYPLGWEHWDSRPRLRGQSLQEEPGRNGVIRVIYDPWPRLEQLSSVMLWTNSYGKNVILIFRGPMTIERCHAYETCLLDMGEVKDKGN